MGFYTIPQALIDKSARLITVCKSAENKALAKDIKELLEFLKINNKVSSILGNAPKIKEDGKSIRDRLVNLKVTDETYEDAKNLAAFFKDVSEMHGKKDYIGTIFQSDTVIIDVFLLPKRVINFKEISNSYQRIINAKVAKFEARNAARFTADNEARPLSPIKIDPPTTLPDSKNARPSVTSQNKPEAQVADDYVYVKKSHKLKFKLKDPKKQWEELTNLFSLFVPEEPKEKTPSESKKKQNRQTVSVQPKKVEQETILPKIDEHPLFVPVNNSVKTQSYRQKIQKVTSPATASQLGFYSLEAPSEKPSISHENSPPWEMPNWLILTLLLSVVGIPILVGYGIYKCIADSATAEENYSPTPNL